MQKLEDTIYVMKTFTSLVISNKQLTHQGTVLYRSQGSIPMV